MTKQYMQVNIETKESRLCWKELSSGLQYWWCSVLL